MTICKYRDVSERDMDLLFMETFATDKAFSGLFLEKTSSAAEPFTVLHAERSKVDNGLGESDLTVIYEISGKKHALLIEDKIDAIAMTDQHERYLKRGQKGVKNGEYDSFDVFIICPEKYRNTNEEAGKYEFFVSYEECRDYFAGRDDVYSKIRYQQISQAIETMKAEYKVDINEIAVQSFKKYAEYQAEYYPRLDLRNKADGEKVNGWWPHFAVGVKEMYILHKTDRNFVDLTISNAADRIPQLSAVLTWLHENGRTHITLEKTGKSAAFRIKTPPIKMSEPFDTWNMDNLKECFDVIQELADLAGMFVVIDKVIFGGNNGK